MRIHPGLCLVCALFGATPGAAEESSAPAVITINPTVESPLFDGRCGDDEWRAATRIDLPAQASIRLMHDGGSLYVCAQGKAEDYVVIDLYIEHASTGHLHNLHASAQLGERLLTDEAWSESEFWALEGWSGFWVPYAGNEETENGIRPRFLRGSHREIQVLRTKFAGTTWRMMIGVSAIHEDGESRGFVYPENAVDTDASTWLDFRFSDA